MNTLKLNIAKLRYHKNTKIRSFKPICNVFMTYWFGITTIGCYGCYNFLDEKIMFKMDEVIFMLSTPGLE